MNDGGWSLSAISDAIQQQGDRRRAQEAEHLKVLEEQLPNVVGSLKDQTAKDLMQLWANNVQASHQWMMMRRQRALHRLFAHLCRKELLRRCGEL
jgi:hypothetical protein